MTEQYSAIAGTIWTSVPDRQLGVVDRLSHSIPLLAIRYHSMITDYHEGDMVVFERELYRAKYYIRAREFSPIDWDVYTHTQNTITAIEPYSEEKTYHFGDIVLHDRNLYKCIVQETIPGAFNEVEWQFYDTTEVVHAIKIFHPNEEYFVGDIVLYNNELWRAVVDPGKGEWDVDEWEKYLSTEDTHHAIRIWNNTTNYAKGDLVFKDGEIWRAIDDVLFGMWDASKWEYYVTTSVPVPPIRPFSPNAFYFKGDMVLYQGSLYKAKADMEPQPWFENNWEHYIDNRLPAHAIKLFSITETYGLGDIVLFQTEIYKCIHVTGPGEFNYGHWDLYQLTLAPDTGVRVFDPAKHYPPSALVVYSGEVWRAKVAVDPGPWRDWMWDNYITETTDHHAVRHFTGTGVYKVGDFVIYDGHIFKCLVANGPGHWVEAYWEQYDNTPKAITGFSEKNVYEVGDVVFHAQELWRCKTHHPAGEWNEVHWERYIHERDDSNLLVASNNLSELTNKQAARDNLELGPYATRRVLGTNDVSGLGPWASRSEATVSHTEVTGLGAGAVSNIGTVFVSSGNPDNSQGDELSIWLKV